MSSVPDLCLSKESSVYGFNVVFIFIIFLLPITKVKQNRCAIGLSYYSFMRAGSCRIQFGFYGSSCFYCGIEFAPQEQCFFFFVCISRLKNEKRIHLARFVANDSLARSFISPLKINLYFHF